MSTNFEMYEMLLERQAIMKDERIKLKASLDTLDNKINIHLAHLKNRPREKDEELVKRLNDVETYHATHPQSNQDEREFMREVKVLKNKRKELVEYNIKQSEIDELKALRSTYQRELKDKELCLDELFAGARKMRAAHKLNCDPSALQEETMNIPNEKFRFIIGPGGSNVKKMEDECFVHIDMDKPRAVSTEGKLKLYFDPSRNKVEEAKRLIQIILDTRTDDLNLCDEKIVCLLIKRAAIVMKLQEMYNVRIDISRAKLSCKVTGLNEDVDKAVTAINSLEVSLSRIDLLDRRVISYILGKGRPIFNKLVDEHSVDVQLDKDSNPPTATIVGGKAGVATVTVALKNIVEENREIEEEMICDKHIVLDAIIGTKGVIISQLQRDFNVRLTVDKDRSTLIESIIEIKGNSRNVKAVKENILERIRAFQSETVIIDIPDGLLPAILGKKGSRISELRKRHSAVTIDVLADTNSIRFHSADPVQRLSAVDEVEKFIASNMHKDFPMNRSTTITLKGARGSVARKYLTDTLKLNFDIDTEGEMVRLRGRVPDIDQGIQFLTMFCEDNFELEMSCSKDDSKSLLNGKDDSPLRAIEKKYGINVYFSRDKDLFRIVGQRNAAHDAQQYIQDFLDGDTDNSTLVSITASCTGAFVGRGGSHIKSFEQKHNVHVDILKSRNQVRLHGNNPSDVEAARLDLLRFLDSLTVNVIIENILDKWANRCESVLGTLDDLLVSAETIFGVGVNKLATAGDGVKKNMSVTLFGTPRRANAARDYVLDEIRGITNVALHVLPQHFELLSNSENLSKLQHCVRNLDISISLKDCAIIIEGPVNNVPKAKININRLLDYLFTGEFSSVVADTRTLLSLWNFETELDFQNHVAGGQISFDMQMSCIRIFASTSISHTLGVEYIREKIVELKKRLILIEINEDIFKLLSSKKSSYIVPVETEYNCKIVLVNQATGKSSDDKIAPILELEGSTESQARNGATAIRNVIERLEKENWKISLKSDIAGALIGKGGEHVKALREETKSNINIDMRTGIVEVSGNEEAVTDAKNRILQFVEEKERESHVTYIPITPECVSRIIGTKGAKIRDIQSSSHAVSIDINRNENVVIVKGSVESGIKAKEDIVNLLKRDGLDISNLHYTSPQEREAVEKKAREEARKVEDVHVALVPQMGTKEACLELLNTSGLNKNALRRAKRRIRMIEEQEKLVQSEKHEPRISEHGDFSDKILPSLSDSDKASDKPNSNEEISTAADLDSSSSRPIQALGSCEESIEKHAKEEILLSHPAVSVQSTSPSSRPVVPSGTAGNLLSMILGTTPVSSSASRLCSPRVMSNVGFKLGVIGSVGHPVASSKAQDNSQQSQRSHGTETQHVASYYKSKTGRAIRLD